MFITNPVDCFTSSCIQTVCVIIAQNLMFHEVYNEFYSNRYKINFLDHQLLLQSLVFEAYYHDICLGQLRGLKNLKHSRRKLFQPLLLFLCRNFDSSQVAFPICTSSLYKFVQFVSSYGARGKEA